MCSSGAESVKPLWFALLHWHHHHHHHQEKCVYSDGEDVKTQQSECFLCRRESCLLSTAPALRIVLFIRSCLVCCGCKWEIGGALGGRAGHSVINVPIAVIIRLMASLSDGMLGARPRGARLKRLQAPTPPVINSTCLFTKIWVLQIMSFTVRQSYRVSLLPGLEMGKLIVPLKQIGITPLDALMSECECVDVPDLTADGILRSEKHTGGEDSVKGCKDMQDTHTHTHSSLPAQHGPVQYCCLCEGKCFSLSIKRKTLRPDETLWDWRMSWIIQYCLTLQHLLQSCVHSNKLL